MTTRVTTSLGALLKERGSSIKTGPFGTTLRAAEYSKAGVPVVSVGEIGHGALHIHRTTPRVGSEVVHRLPEYVLRVGDIVFGRKGAVDRCGLVRDGEGGYFLGSDGIRVRLGTSVDPGYVTYYLQSPDIRGWLLQNASGTTMPSLNQEILARVPLILPSFAEQLRISAALDDAGKEISVLERLIAKKQAIKQGMMQQLLTGRTRLPGFNDHWNRRRVAELIDGLEAGVSVRSTTGATGGPAILKTSCVDNGKFVPSEAKRIMAADISRARCNPVGGSLIISRMNTPALVGDVGYVDETRLDLFLPDRLWLARAKLGTANDMHRLTYYFASAAGAKHLRGLATGTSGSMKNIPKNRLLGLEVTVPSEAEQRAISDVLQAIDSEVDALRARLRKARSVKTGMTQQFLTGRTRLPITEAAS